MAKTKVETTAEAKAKITLTISGVQEDLKNGLDRKAIGEKYNLPPGQVKLLFQNPKLKGLKVKKTPEAAFDLVDDVDETPTKKKAVTSKAEDKAGEEQESKDVTKSTISEDVKLDLVDDTKGQSESGTTTTSDAPVTEKVGLW